MHTCKRHLRVNLSNDEGVQQQLLEKMSIRLALRATQEEAGWFTLWANCSIMLERYLCVVPTVAFHSFPRGSFSGVLARDAEKAQAAIHALKDRQQAVRTLNTWKARVRPQLFTRTYRTICTFRYWFGAFSQDYKNGRSTLDTSVLMISTGTGVWRLRLWASDG